MPVLLCKSGVPGGIHVTDTSFLMQGNLLSGLSTMSACIVNGEA